MSKSAFKRILALLFALLLCAQSTAVVLAELNDPDPDAVEEIYGELVDSIVPQEETFMMVPGEDSATSDDDTILHLSSGLG